MDWVEMGQVLHTGLGKGFMTTERPGAIPCKPDTESGLSLGAWIGVIRSPLRWALFLSGIIFTGASVALVVRSDMGVSVLVSVPYMLSLSLPAISLGSWNYVVQGVLMFLLVPILRTFKLQWILSFAVSVLFGLTIDLFTFFCSFLPGTDVALRLVYFSLGFLLLTLGVPLTIKSGFPALPFDVFVKELATSCRKNFRQVKTVFDMIFLSISLALMVLVVQRMTGIGIGTFFSAFANGTMMQFWLRRLDKLLPVLSMTQ
jgi:uncharacterized membrane protein YczE